jgi:peroxiredoxin
VVRPLVFVALVALSSCAAVPAQVRDVPDATLVAPAEGNVAVRALVARAPFTVFFFFSDHCPCVTLHDARLRELHERYRARGVQFVAVDSEVGASPERETRAAQTHGYPFPILIDRGAALASALGAEYASYTVVVDAKGRVHYAGGIDSDKTHLRDDASFYVRDALDDLLAGREPRVAHGKTLGCALQTW